MLPWRYERDMLRKERGEKGKMPLSVLSLGLFLSDRLKARRGRSILEARYDDLLLRRRDEIRYGEALNFSRILLLTAAGALITAGLLLGNRGDDTVRALRRPDFGSSESVSVKARIGEEEEDLLINVSGRDPAGEELEAALDEAFEELKVSCLAGNEAADRVTESLNFPSESDSGIRFVYRSNAPDLLSDYGTFLMEEEEIPEEGITVVIRVAASYNGMEKTYPLEITLVKRTEELTPREEVERALRRADEEGKSEEDLVLPEEVEGFKVSFRLKRTSPWLAFLISLALSVLLFFLPREKEKELTKAREKELELSYPQLLSKLDTLINAGMSIRGAWTRIVREYREGRKSGERKREYAYEEMSLTLLRLEQGENEGDAYEEFGRRCTLRSYRKLGNLLGQNLRQGISGLEGTLREEMDKALEDRKNRALRAGEEAGTKLLFPMILMLGIVVVTLVVPAFLSF